MRRFLLGLACGVLAALIVPLGWLALGGLDVAASSPPGMLERRLAPWVRDRSIAARAARQQYASIPSSDAQLLPHGLGHFRDHCLPCHDAPGVPSGDLSEGLRPPAPKLYERSAQDRPDAELEWIVTHGIRWTAMPAFGKSHDPSEVRAIVAFVRHLPRLTNAERLQLGGRGGHGTQPHHSH